MQCYQDGEAVGPLYSQLPEGEPLFVYVAMERGDAVRLAYEVKGC